MRVHKAIPLSAVILAAVSVLSNLNNLQPAQAQPLVYETQAQADGAEVERPLFLRFFLKRMATRLDLTDSQKGDIRAIVDAELPVIKPLIARIMENRDQMETINTDASFNETATRALVEQQTLILNDLLVEKERLRYEINQVLTPEQRTKAGEFRQRIERRLQKWLES